MPEVVVLKKKSYLAMIENSSKGENLMFRNLYAVVDGTEKDILKDGRLSCAVFASAVLYVNKLVKDVHGTVNGTEKDLIESGWMEAKEIKPGAVLIWEEQLAPDGVLRRHVGFAMGNDEAVSNSSENGRVPKKHHITYDNTRQIEKIFWHPSLN
ncbi:MAG: hypothetical protein A3I96_02680 [Candidatus Yanofskybacteria bacterium RIFCSPLOWO2_02_FULL_44_18]|nr:MAG: hypothetical protein A3I96_02680 [Candidatus Yanofskybacteria bacterium RIFCSPLOWO2_02_FULL_44_18]